MRIAFVSTWPSRRCGIATFTSDLIEAVHAADESVVCEVAAIDERNSVRAYGPEVRWRIRQGSPDGYVAAARAIGGSDADVVCVQHEFGLYGLWKDEAWEGDAWIEGTYIDHLTPFLQEVGKPVGRDDAHRAARAHATRCATPCGRSSANADHLIVMAETAVDILREVYGVTTPADGDPARHAAHRAARPAQTEGEAGPRRATDRGDVRPGRPRQGPRVRDRGDAVGRAAHPDALYLIAGQTHPSCCAITARSTGTSSRR